MSKRILILGKGLIGSHLLTEMKKTRSNVTATERASLDVRDQESIRAFPWKQFDVVVNCTGNIDYRNTPAAAVRNFEVNVLGPLRILEQLKNGQLFYHCSTQAVLSPDQNTYSLSKSYFEKAVEGHPVVLLRLPAIFTEEKPSGLLHRIRTAYERSTPLELDFTAKVWHPMYLPRCIGVLKTLIEKDCRDHIVTIGYPLAIDLMLILQSARDFYGEIAVTLKQNTPDGYLPDLDIQTKYVTSRANDFGEDLRTYFSFGGTQNVLRTCVNKADSCTNIKTDRRQDVETGASYVNSVRHS